MNKKIYATSMVVTLAMLLVACGGEDAASSSVDTDTSQSSTQVSSQNPTGDVSGETSASSQAEDGIASVDTDAPDASDVEGASSTEESAAPVVSGNVKEGIAVTPEEEEEGQYYTDAESGFKFIHPANIAQFKDAMSIYTVGSTTDSNNPIYAGTNFEWLPRAVIDRYNEIASNNDLTDEQKRDEMAKDVWPNTKHLYALLTFRTPLLPKTDAEFTAATGFDHNEILRSNDKYTHVFSTNDEDLTNLSDEDIADYKAIRAEIPTVRQSLGVADPAGMGPAISGDAEWTFTTTDLEGNPVDQSVFSKAPYTLVNVWATWCGPCVKEIPEIAKIASEYETRGLQVVGIVTDVTAGNDSYLATANQILSDSQANYLNLMASDTLNDTLLSSVRSIPTTFLVDNTGKVVGDLQVGSLDADGFRAFITKNAGI